MSTAELSRFGKHSGKFCLVPQCTSRKAPSIFFHKIPDNAEKKKEWGKKFKIGKAIIKYMMVCTKYFQKSDYIFPGKFNIYLLKEFLS